MTTIENFKCIFWGKFQKNGPSCLPLAAHCLDVAMTFRKLVELAGIRRSLELAAGRALGGLDFERLAVLAMLHDVGKANLGFQFKVFDPKSRRAGHIRELAPLFEEQTLNHRFAQALDIEALFPWVDTDHLEILESLLLATWSHHGQPLCFKGEQTSNYFLAKTEWWQPKRGWNPFTEVANLMEQARKVFPRAFAPSEIPLPAEPRFHHLFAGLVMLADWLGSHPAHFPIQRMDTVKRSYQNRAIIPGMLKGIGLDTTYLQHHLAKGPCTFEDRFRFPPRPLQKRLHELDPHDPTTCLLIAESETGSGKTEAALDWFCTLFSAGLVDGLYFALPTRVAARELYGRVNATLARWFPEPDNRPVTVLAVPGYAQVDGLPPEHILPDVDAANLWQDDEDLRRRERIWAAEHPKRFLAATVAVGTVDQALLSCVQSKHAHLRSVCLGRSLLVVDEVHASDIYMTALLRHLLNHHLTVGGRALLLSATLGSHARTDLLQMDGDKSKHLSLEAAKAIDYPALTLGSGQTLSCGPTQESNHKTVEFELVPHAFIPEAIGELIASALDGGAKVLVVMNTVSRAIAFQRILEVQMDSSHLFRCHGIVCPHHGRFAPEDRLILDKSVSMSLGRDASPGSLLLIGTQTLEQSLDIDADLLISDLCPADVLLQRVGRLHRHQRTRPSGLETPRCLVLIPEHEDLENALDNHGNVFGNYKGLGYGSVYADLRTLELTQRVLAASPAVQIPTDNRRLVETITHPESLKSLTSNRWLRHAQNVEGEGLAKELSGNMVLLPFNQLFGKFEYHEANSKVATRLGVGNLEIMLDRKVTGPFGQALTKLVIPGHLAPEKPVETLSVTSASAKEICVSLRDQRTGKDWRYRYTRFGLEKEDS